MKSGILFLAMLAPAWCQGTHLLIGRYHCGGAWRDFEVRVIASTGLLGVEDPDGPATSSMTVRFHRTVVATETATYKLQGKIDDKTGRFHFEPQAWAGAHPSGLEMYGVEGTVDAATHKVTGRMLSGQCDAVAIVLPGDALPPAPDQPPPLSAADRKRPEMLMGATNVTNYLDVAAKSPDFEYRVQAWSDPPGVLHQGEPIDESVANMQKDKFACGGSQRVTWDAAGLHGTAPDRVSVTERFVVECVGNCKGVFYRPYVGANVTHFGLMQPLPTMQIKSVFFGGTSFQWKFSRTANTQPPPEIYIHRWVPQTGSGPFDGTPAEIARKIAAAPPCRAPKSGR